MNVKDIKVQDLEMLFNIYYCMCGGNDYKKKSYINLEYITNDIHNKGHSSKDGYRLGSDWSNNSKIRFEYKNNEVIPIFNPNMQKNELFMMKQI